MFIVLIITVLILSYLYLKYHYEYWKRLGIPGPKPKFFLGNMLEMVQMKKNLGMLTFCIYNDFKDCEHDFIGIYKFLKPAIIVKSPELVNKITIKDFSHFRQNNFYVGDHDEIGSRNPVMQSGIKWKKTRSRITPAFTKGKLKTMTPLTLNASNNLVDYINKNISINKDDGFIARDIFNKYSTDNTASVAFGLEINSFEESGNEFMEMGQKTLNLNFKSGLRFMMIFNFPKLAALFKLVFIPRSVGNYFRKVILDALEIRRKTSIIRNDFLQHMIQMREKHGNNGFEDVDIISQCISFLINGIEASSATMGFLFYLISKDLEVQEKMQKEIDNVFEKYQGDITYEAIKEMVYLDQVVNETFRLYPGALITGKKCTKKYTIPKTDKTPEITLEPGTPVIIPLGAFHRDARYFPNPDKFDPERFSPENVHLIQKHTYLPFGEGPRICLGQRFALLQTKVAVARLVKEFDVRVNQKTTEPFVMSAKTFLLRSVNPIYLNFYKREANMQ